MKEGGVKKFGLGLAMLRPGVRGSRRKVLNLLLPLAWGVLAFWLHHSWLVVDQALPSGDAPGHLLNVTRYQAWFFQGRGTPMEPFLPGVYLPAAGMLGWLGPSMDTTRLAVAAFAALGVAGMSALGLMLQGVTAGVLLPLVWLGAPSATNYSHLLLMDVPAAALIPWVLWGLWGSQGFYRLLPTLAFGFFLGWAVLNKFTIVLFLLVPLAVAGMGLVIRAPLGLVPLLLAGVPIARGLQGAWSRRHLAAAMHTGPDAAGVKATVLWLAASLGISLVLWGVFRHRASLRRGLALASAALVSGLVVLPWLHALAPSVWEKLYREGVAEVIVTDPARVLVWNMEQLLVVVPRTWWWAQLAFWLMLLVPLGLKRERLQFLLGPAVYGVGWRLWELVASAALGTWLISQTLPINARYVLPATLLLVIALGVAVCRVRLTRWTLAPLLGLQALGQLLAPVLPSSWSLELREPVDQKVRAGAVRGSRLLAAAAPQEGLQESLESALVALVTLPGVNQRCRQVGFSLGPGLRVEPRTVVAMGTLFSLRECVWVSLRDQGSAGLEDPRAVLVLGTSQEQAIRTAGRVAIRVGASATLVATEAGSTGPWLFDLNEPQQPQRETGGPGPGDL